ncbi:MAG: CAP domain-containing protein [Syntrophorhabdus sp.]
MRDIIIGLLITLVGIIMLDQVDIDRSSFPGRNERFISGEFPYPVLASTADMEESPVLRTIGQEEVTARELFRLTNKIRKENNAPLLKENPMLNETAEIRVEDMFKKQYFGHMTPAGEDPADIAKENGYFFRKIGENLAEGQFPTNQEVINGWMQSPGHRKNLLSKDYTEMGIAVKRGEFKGADSIIAVQILGKPWP